MANIRFINPGKNARSLPSDPSARSDVEQVMEHGYIVMKDVFTRGEAESVKTEIKRLTGSAPLTGRNNFEGVDTTRIYSLLNKSRKFDDFCIIPRVLALNDYFLDPGYMISVLQTIQINPGEKAQPLHHDDAYTGLPRPRDPLSTGIVFAFDEFTETNGATRIIPGSHKWDSNRIPQEHETIPMACPAGSVL
ncbi:MAG: hypothetical protein M1820_000828 [Bogoriella megaspora]|nr:MAG: hypothetical protein M1820_000828 [Bogoriella megaspora]